jgi:hypothetical protein
MELDQAARNAFGDGFIGTYVCLLEAGALGRGTPREEVLSRVAHDAKVDVEDIRKALTLKAADQGVEQACDRTRAMAREHFGKGLEDEAEHLMYIIELVEEEHEGTRLRLL